MTLAENSKTFLSYLENWVENLPIISLEQAVPVPAKGAVISVDVINGFLYEGALASPRVAAIDRPIAQLMQAAWDHGVRDILLVQDRHEDETLEFGEFGSHAVAGSPEAETIDMIKELPFYGELAKIYKDTIHPALNTEFDSWVSERDQLETFFAVGDVTDLCVYQLATYLRLSANAHRLNRRVIVPANCVQTWHLSVADAENLPAMPHHGDMLHATFLYHMALNGIEIVKEIKH